MKNPFDSLFGRSALVLVGFLVVVQLTSLLIVDRDRTSLDAERIARLVTSIDQMRKHEPELAGDLARNLGLLIVDANALAQSGCPAQCADTHGLFERHILQALPQGGHVSMSDSGTVWVRPAGERDWLVIPAAMVSFTRLNGATALMLIFALMLALLCAWHLHRPMRALARAARQYRTDRIQRRIALTGPIEMRELIADFNDLVDELAEAERERAVMLASIAHDLRSPITRMVVRSELLQDARDRTGFVRDTESMSRIVEQFLDFARDREIASPLVSVDSHCRCNYTDALAGQDDGGDALVRLDLRAGPEFALPAVAIDRIMTNLVDNSMSYGQPPIEVATRREQGRFLLIVRDHGPGVPADQVDQVLRPFVRLDAARGGAAHCGLGLAIVQRLVRQHGGVLSISNAPDSGFVATMSFAVRRVE